MDALQRIAENLCGVVTNAFDAPQYRRATAYADVVIGPVWSPVSQPDFGDARDGAPR